MMEHGNKAKEWAKAYCICKMAASLWVNSRMEYLFMGLCIMKMGLNSISEMMRPGNSDKH